MNREAITEAINNTTLVCCTKIAAQVKQPQYIPFFEVYTYSLLARYFDLTERRIRNAYTSNRKLFEDNCVTMSGKEIAMVARDTKPLGISYGYLCEFPNGVVIQVACTRNMVFNSRALLIFAHLLRAESLTAQKINDALNNEDFVENNKSLARMKPWFLANHIEAEHDNVVMNQSVLCPYATNTVSQEELEEEEVAEKVLEGQLIIPEIEKTVLDTTSQISEERHDKKISNKYFVAKKCAVVSKKGKNLTIYNSLSEAAEKLKVSIDGISRCCSGKQKTVRSRNGKKYMFRFVA